MAVVNPRRSTSAILYFSSILILSPASGCAKKPFPVEVAPGFVGYVHIVCGPNLGIPATPIHVDSFGGADADTCPGGDAEVTVFRDGKMVKATAVSWERSGDGTPVALSFNVR
jgi:hypothetical protein